VALLNEIYQALDPVAFWVFGMPIRWYGLAYVAGFLCCALVIWRVAKRWGLKIDFDAVTTIILCEIIGVLVGARLGYCLFYGDGYYLAHPIEILYVNNGGMSFHGGLIGAFIAGAASSKLSRIPYLTIADLAVIGAPLGLAFGRCANFVNGELWGAPTDLPWGVIFGGDAGNAARHPSQLYEALLEGVVLFLVLYALSRRVPPRSRGTFTGTFFVLYGVFRILIEFVREPDVQLGYLAGGWLTMGMVLSVPLVLVGVGLLVFARVRHLPQTGIKR
jgi:phosphatidylglycerol:prolipoprotein diacylglycerol transferase